MTRRQRRLRRVAGALAAILTTGSGLALAAGPAAPTAAAAPAGQPRAALAEPAALTPIHVQRPPAGSGDPTPYLADGNGRRLILRGTNTTGIYRNHDDDYRFPGHPEKTVDPADYANGNCPVNDGRWSNPPVCQVDAGKGMWTSAADASHNDLSQMRRLGFSMLRLVLNWDLLEPQPGVYDDRYVERIAQIVDWAAEQRIYTLVDFHQDQYGDVPRTPTIDLPPILSPPSGQNDGAPRWAVITDGLPSTALLGIQPLNPAVMRAFDNFWQNRPVEAPQGAAPGKGLQDHFIGGFARVVARLKDHPGVAGYEIMNEPQPGSYAIDRFNDEVLYPFSARVIQAVTGVRDGRPDCPAPDPAGVGRSPACAYPDLGVHTTQPIFVEPSATRNLLDVDLQSQHPFTTYPNLVFAPHTYTHIFTLDAAVLRIPREQSFFPASYDVAFDSALTAARAFGAAVVATEFSGAVVDEPTMAAQERHLVPGLMWDWKYNCGLGPDPCDEEGAWSIYASGGPGLHPPLNGSLKQSRVDHLARVYPRATAGSLYGYRYDPATKTFAMSAGSSVAVPAGPEARERQTLVVVPFHVTGAVKVTGAATLAAEITDPDGGRRVFVAPTGAGAYAVNVG